MMNPWEALVPWVLREVDARLLSLELGFWKGFAMTKKRTNFVTTVPFYVWFALIITGLGITCETSRAIDLHDPHIIKHEDYYYIFSTGRRGHVIQTSRSQDLLDWEPVKDIFESLPLWITKEIPKCRGLWSPDIHFINGRYCVYYSASTFGSQFSLIGLATNRTLDPADPNYLWTDEGKVIESRPGMDFNAIDAGIVTDAEGRIWLAFGSHWQGIKLFELNPKNGKSIFDPPKLYSIARREQGVNAIEAPYIIYRNGFYYLFVSFDRCCEGADSTYKIMVGRSKKVTGPYVDAHGTSMMEGGGTLVLQGDERFKGPGHNSILSDNGIDYLVYHTYDAQNRGRPTLRIRPILWRQDGWLDVGQPLSSRICSSVEDTS